MTNGYDLNTAEGRAAAQVAEYGTYRATADILEDDVLAYAEGDRVPVSNVTLHGYTDVEVVGP